MNTKTKLIKPNLMIDNLKYTVLSIYELHLRMTHFAMESKKYSQETRVLNPKLTGKLPQLTLLISFILALQV